ncbi:MAG: DUF6519 domain-containing protein [Proteobacteria bacterium]|nr:DUF6519 domain-containing protein [Pseudomonadota bacterium]
MKAQISRLSQQLRRRYSGVYQQQGRMLTDADWNELMDIVKQHVAAVVADIVGKSAIVVC